MAITLTAVILLETAHASGINIFPGFGLNAFTTGYILLGVALESVYMSL
ncbi:MAG: hypothetical protein QGI60_04235 [archaeon]|nr:hypothetical protein [archaeon]